MKPDQPEDPNTEEFPYLEPKLRMKSIPEFNTTGWGSRQNTTKVEEYMQKNEDDGGIYANRHFHQGNAITSEKLLSKKWDDQEWKEEYGENIPTETPVLYY